MENYMDYVNGIAGVAALTSAAAVATAVYLKNRDHSKLVAKDFAQQSLTLPGEQRERVSRLCGPEGKLLEYLYEDVRTLYDVMKRGLTVSKDGNCLAYRPEIGSPYQYLPYSEVMERAHNFGSGLIHLGLEPGQETYLGVYAQNSVEWIVSEQACYHFSTVIVPLYDTLGPHACTFIVNQASITAVVCDSPSKIQGLFAERAQTPRLKCVVATCDISDDLYKRAQELDIQLHKFDEVIELGRKNKKELVLPKAGDLATVCYTSGTTGNPKGVMLTHGNIVADVSAVMLQMGEGAPNAQDVMMSFLPCAHMLERVCEVAVYMNGGCVGFYLGDIKNLMDDYQALKPTMTPAVPRLLNRIYDKVQAKANSGKFKSWMFKKALQYKMNEVNKYVIRNNSLWDHLVFKKVREGMGGNLRLLVVGSAPLAGDVLTFMRCALGCLVLEGYGQTECVAPCTLSLNGDPAVGHVGPPIPCSSIKLVDVPEMEYFAANGKGEVCIRGYNVFKGYLKDEEKTAETMDKEGWLHTGDIGEWLPNNSLKIVDRKKHIFKLSQGEYIAPEKIENIYQTSKYVAQIFVHGESLKSCLVAIVVPDKETMMSACKSQGIKGSWQELCENKDVKKLLIEDLNALGRKEGLKSFEQIKDIFVASKPFTIENNLLTPTLKTKRPELRKAFSPEIEVMYRSLM